MLASELDWLSGRVTVWKMDALDPRRALTDQQNQLTEDLAQAEYPYDVTIDVGWYTDAFTIVVVYGNDFDKPAFQRRAESLTQLADALRAAIAFADELSATIA